MQKHAEKYRNKKYMNTKSIPSNGYLDVLNVLREIVPFLLAILSHMEEKKRLGMKVCVMIFQIK